MTNAHGNDATGYECEPRAAAQKIKRSAHRALPRPSPPRPARTRPRPARGSAGSILAAGSTHRVKPSCAASRTRRPPAQFRALRRQADLAEDGRRRRASPRLRRLEATAATTLRSAAGSSIVMPPGDVDEDILAGQVRPARFSSTASSSDSAALVDAVGRAARVAERAAADQRLHLDQQRARPFDEHRHGRPRRVGGALGQKQLRRIGHRSQALARHLEDAQLADGAEAILHGTDDTVRVVTLAFEVEHGVDDVLERLGTGQRRRPW